MDYGMIMFVVVGFLAVVLLLEGGYLFWNTYRGAETQRIQRRLAAMSGAAHVSGDFQLLKQRVLSASPSVERALLRVPRVYHLDSLLLQCGLRMNVGAFIGLTLACAAVGFALGLLFPIPWWAAIGCALAAAALPLLYVLRRRRERLKAIEHQLPDVLDLIARALRAGHAFPSAVQMVGAESPEPLAQEFRIVFGEVNFGVPMQDALTNLAKRVPLTDLHFFVIAVAIQRETGGNLAELLVTLAGLMRARFKLLGTVRVLSAEGRLSAWILTILPFVLLAAINAINPKFMSVLWTDSAGITTIYFGITFMVIGIIWMWRVIRIRI